MIKIKIKINSMHGGDFLKKIRSISIDGRGDYSVFKCCAGVVQG